MRMRLCAMAALWLALSASSAGAVSFLWTLEDVTFDNGDTATGQFTYDPSVGVNGTYTDASIIVHLVCSTRCDIGFGNPAAAVAPNEVDFSRNGKALSLLLHLAFQSQLIPTGPRIPTSIAILDSSFVDVTLPGTVFESSVTRGSVNMTAPLPPAFALMLTGLASILLPLRRRRNHLMAPMGQVAYGLRKKS